MPCYDPRAGETKTVYPKQKKKLNNMLQGALCAIANELERRGILVEVFQNAQREGLIDLFSWLEKHKQDDKIRLAKDIQKRYSKDELAIIKQLI